MTKLAFPEEKKKKTCAFYRHTTCSVPFAHTESSMHEQLDKQNNFFQMPERPVVL